MKQREIKFRVWDKENKWFIDNGNGLSFVDLAEYDSENQEEYEEEGKPNNFYIFQQFTGLTDKHGKEIYEGDIVEEICGEAIIQWNQTIFKVEYKGYKFSPFDYVTPNNYKVIGNIFENKDLIK